MGFSESQIRTLQRHGADTILESHSGAVRNALDNGVKPEDLIKLAKTNQIALSTFLKLPYFDLTPKKLKACDDQARKVLEISKKCYEREEARQKDKNKT
jgi:hypothetical protein